MAKILNLSLLICCLAAQVLVAVSGPRERKFRDLKTIKSSLSRLEEKFNELEARIEGPDGSAISKCASNQIKFIFSGDDRHGSHDDHGHHDDHDDHGHHDDHDCHVCHDDHGHHDDLGCHNCHDDHGHEDLHVNVNLRFTDFHHGGFYEHFDDHDHQHAANCKFDNGQVYITQNAHDRYAKFKFSFTSVEVDELDVHVHETGDISKGCSNVGNHYDPIDDDRDVGDLGIIRADEQDIKAVWFNDTKLSLNGPFTILGRSIVGHDHDGGDKLMCCVIVRAAEDHDHHGHGHHHDHDHKGDDRGHDGDDRHYR